MTKLNKCSNWKRYRAIRKPKCNKGNPCKYCNDLWNYKISNHTNKKIRDSELYMFRILWMKAEERGWHKEQERKIMFTIGDEK
ncbi:hypothetical protein LCGC14_1740370 [marine sediment metagenome]|uniref:Uncharacterized protein n=1 Tax=marine sediment metagenome TaxID=412755 RepID=A0A0F9H6Z4_9ZZZZ